jgi:hypothetical protein
MKYIKALLAITMCALFYVSGRYSVGEHECKDEYKEAYMNHIELCDTLHNKCFRIGN